MFIIIQAVSAVLAGAILAYLAVNGRRNQSTSSYMLCVFLMMLWNLSEIGLIDATDPVRVTIALKVKFLPVVYIGASWLYFCLATAHSNLAENRYFKFVLFTIPAVFYLFMVTNEWHHLFYLGTINKVRLSRGPLFWAHTIESYICILCGTAYLFIKMQKMFGKSKRESRLLLMAVVLPMAANVLMLLNIFPVKGVDITPQVMLLSMIFLGVAVAQKRFLNLIPVAARDFIENTAQGILITDHEERVVGMNEAAVRLVPELGLKIYDPVDKIIGYLQKNSASEMVPQLVEVLKGREMKPANGNIRLNGRDFSIEARALKGFRQANTGRMLIMKDRTNEQRMLDEINTKNLLLTEANDRLTQSNDRLIEANQRLEQLSSTIEELAISRERNRVGREVHDTVGHTLTLLVALAENMKLQLNADQEGIKNALDKSIGLSRQALNDIRSCLNGFCLDSFESVGLSEWMNHLMKTNETSGTRVEYSISGKLPELDAARVMAIYRVCQESITNAIRHGQAQKVSIIIKCMHNALRIYIFDDGKGCGEIVRGYGLTGMEERLAKLGGSISFGSDGEKGFNIIAELPLPEADGS